MLFHHRNRRHLAGSIFAFCLSLAGPPVFANGWEHTSIDFDVLVTALADDNPDLRRRAAESIGFRHQPGATEALLARLGQGESAARVRREIYASLGKLGNDSALPTLAGCIEDEADVAARVECAFALGNLDNTAAGASARDALSDPSPEVRLAAVSSLGSFDDSATLQKLVELAGDAEQRTRNTALIALGRTRSSSATPVLVDALKTAPGRAQALAALRGLTLLAEPSTADVVQSFYQREEDALLRRHALVAMANIRTQDSEKFFLDTLNSDDHESQLIGLAVLRKFGNAQQAPAVAERGLGLAATLYRQPAGILVDNLVQTMNRLELLLAYLKTVIRLDPAAGEALFLRCVDSVALPRTQSAELKIAQGFYQLRWQSLYGLGYTGSERARAVIETALADPDARIRAVSTRSMGVIGAADGQALVAGLLDDEAAEVRWMAARVLGRLGVASAAPDLLRSLDDRHTQVRLEAALALGYLKTETALARLRTLARTDADSRVSEAAEFAATLIE